MHKQSSKSGNLASVNAIKAMLDWWHDAGVDMDFTDNPHTWLTEPKSEETVTASKPSRRVEKPRQTPMNRAFAQTEKPRLIGGTCETWPQDLTKFHEYWLSEASLTTENVEKRLSPHGVADARLMVLVATPFRDDGDMLLSGEAGGFLKAILRAMQIELHETYFASALPASITFIDWDELSANGLRDVTVHHIALARPKRVLVLGRGMAPIFGLSPQQAREPTTIKTEGGAIPLLLVPDLAELSRSPQRRRNFWNRWLEWTA